MAEIIVLPAGTERFVLTGDTLEPGQIVARPPEGADLATANGGVVAFASGEVVVVEGPVFVVPMAFDRDLDVYAFRSMADAVAFADKAQERLGESGMAYDVRIDEPYGVTPTSLDEGLAAFVEAYYMEDGEED